MREWYRIVPFESENNQKEVWILKNGKKEKKFEVEVTLGKPIDILSLKIDMIENFETKVKQIKNSRIELFKKDLEPVNTCPICEFKVFRKAFSVYNAHYYQCDNCSHLFIKERPTKAAIEQFYSTNKSYQKTYADKRTTETRVKQVAVPKLNWAINQFKKVYGRNPKSFLDVGAGSGHFVYACRNLGLKADGFELSESGINFCKKMFGIDLINKDFLKNWNQFSEYDIVTFWGVIEHVHNPLEMLKCASMAIKKEGLVIAAVPRWDCFSTAVQSNFNKSIIRHLEPLGHLHIFTDSSFATAFELCGLEITGAWYFGMDAYELITQLAFSLKKNEIIEQLGKYILSFQNTLDLARLSDEIVIAGKIKE